MGTGHSTFCSLHDERTDLWLFGDGILGAAIIRWHTCSIERNMIRIDGRSEFIQSRGVCQKHRIWWETDLRPVKMAYFQHTTVSDLITVHHFSFLISHFSFLISHVEIVKVFFRNAEANLHSEEHKRLQGSQGWWLDELQWVSESQFLIGNQKIDIRWIDDWIDLNGFWIFTVPWSNE
jgi:hypothetical protein